MSNLILLLLAATILWTYMVDTTSRRLMIPSVLPLVGTGLVANVLCVQFGVGTTWVNDALPIMGTVGLILIVLEGSMDLTLSRSRAPLIGRSLLVATSGFIACTALFVYLAQISFGLQLYEAAVLAIPFAVISSAVAIPSSRVLQSESREFVVYESSISDIIGVLVFFAWVASNGDQSRFLQELLGGGIISLAISVLLSFGLFMVVNHLRGHVRFVPILAGLFLLYATGKWLHLSPLLLVLLFGLLLNNGQILRRWPRLDKWMSADFERSAQEFKQIVGELEFAVRGVFFVLLGLWTPISALLDWYSWVVAAGMTCIIFALRHFTLKLFRIADARRLIWLAPRGLITVLLFLSVSDTVSFGSFPMGAVTLTVMLTCVAVLASRAKGDTSAMPETRDALPVPSEAGPVGV